jgi:hypothetical protein
MHLLRTALLLALLPALLLPPATASAQDDGPKGYTCTLTRGTSQAWVEGRFRTRPAKRMTIVIDAIDLAGQRADLVTGDGRGTLRIVRALDAIHFLEVVAEGYLNVTTVYARDNKRGIHPAAHSRHFGLFGEPLIAQYAGTCTAR